MIVVTISTIVMLSSMFYLVVVCAGHEVSMNGDISDMPLDMQIAIVLLVSSVIVFAASTLYVIVTDPTVLL